MDVTREQLATALLDFYVEVRDPKSGEPVCAQVADSGDLAKAIFNSLLSHAAQGTADAELTAMAAIVAALDALDDGESAGQPHGPFWRALYYAAARYGYVLCTEG